MRFHAAAVLATAAVASVGATVVPVRRSPGYNVPKIVTPVLKSFGFDTAAIAVIAKPNAPSRGPANNFWETWLEWLLEYELTSHPAPQSPAFESWTTFKANGVNLGSWFEIETNYSPNVIPDPYSDEWTWCGAVGFDVCGPVLENHYATFITTSDIDTLAKYGVNTLRIPLTYAAFYDVPGSQLYHGNQLKYLSKVAEYAINTYAMHVVVGLHSLPGGVNYLVIGEAPGHIAWWQNATYFDQSLLVVNAALDFIESSPNTAGYTFSPINEPCDNVQNLFTNVSVSYPDGVNYLNTYLRTVYGLVQNRSMPTTVMLSDTFAGASYWAPFWPSGSNIAFDTHKYYFEVDGVTGYDIPTLACAAAKAENTTFPVYVGEFSTAGTVNNTLATRPQIFQSQVYAWNKYLSGGTFWNLKYLDNDTITSGEGYNRDYWSYYNLISAGAILPGGTLKNVYKDC